MNVVACFRKPGRNERCETESELAQWLEQDGVQYSPDDLAAALIQLERAGILLRLLPVHVLK